MFKSIRTLARTLTLTAATLVVGTGVAAASEPGDLALPSVEQSFEQPDEGARFDAANTLEGVININTASSAELQLLPGIGPATAERIISYRKEHPFQQRNHIMRVKGIGQKTFAKLKDFLTVEGDTTLKIVK
jgi:competence protein ComEA